MAEQPESGRSAGSAIPYGLLTQKQYADRKGWSKQYVNQLVRQGRIPLTQGRIDPGLADAALERSRDPGRERHLQAEPIAAAPTASVTQPDQAAQLHGSFAKARTMREHFRAQRERMEYEAQIGRLVAAEEVRDAAFEVARFTREEVLKAADTIGVAIAAEFGIDEHRVSALVDEQLRRCVGEIARALGDDKWGFARGYDCQV